MLDIQSAAAEIRRGKKEEEEEDRKKPQGKNIMACPFTLGGHKQGTIYILSFSGQLLQNTNS